MRRTMVLLALTLAVGAAGPVADYLGIRVGKGHEADRVGCDSIHFVYPVPYDTTIARNWTDSAAVIAETLYQGSPAYLIRHVTAPETSATTEIDTAYETGNTMRQSIKLGELVLWPDRFVVPFSVGNWWALGLQGTYHADLNGDGFEDTLSVWADTARIVGIEDVVVPYGTFRDCFKILRTTTETKSYLSNSIPTRETSYARHTEWYKDSVWWVRDTTNVFGHTHQYVDTAWVRIGDFVRSGRRELTSLIGVAEPEARNLPRILARPNPFRQTAVFSGFSEASIIEIRDRSGRLVREVGSGNPVWNGTDQRNRLVPAGVYFCREAGPKAAGTVRLVKLN